MIYIENTNLKYIEKESEIAIPEIYQSPYKRRVLVVGKDQFELS